MCWEYFAYAIVITKSYLDDCPGLALTAVDISDDINASPIESYEAKGEKNAHGEANMIRSASKPRNHG